MAHASTPAARCSHVGPGRARREAADGDPLAPGRRDFRRDWCAARGALHDRERLVAPLRGRWSRGDRRATPRAPDGDAAHVDAGAGAHPSAARGRPDAGSAADAVRAVDPRGKTPVPEVVARRSQRNYRPTSPRLHSPKPCRRSRASPGRIVCSSGVSTVPSPPMSMPSVSGPRASSGLILWCWRPITASRRGISRPCDAYFGTLNPHSGGLA